MLGSVTILRDVFGKLAFLFENATYPDRAKRTELENCLTRDLQGYYSGNIYWEEAPNKKYQKPIIDMMHENRVEWCEIQNIKFYLSERPIAKKAWVRVKTAGRYQTAKVLKEE